MSINIVSKFIPIRNIFSDIKNRQSNGYIFKDKMSISKVKAEEYIKNTKLKTSIAKKYMFILYILCPQISMIGVSGSIATETPEENDDIDIVIIAKPNSIWLVRSLDFLIYTILKKRRNINSKNLNNKFCFNLYLSENKLAFEDKNIFTALQILSIKILYGESTYLKLLNANKWIEQFQHKPILKKKKMRIYQILREIVYIILIPVTYIINNICMILQSNRMNKHLSQNFYYDKYCIRTYPKDLNSKIQNYLSKQKTYDAKTNRNIILK